MDDPTAIPAATVQDVDLSAGEPELAAEVHRLGDLMDPGRETPDGFAVLCESSDVRFDFLDPVFVAADVSSVCDQRYLLLRWVRGVWELAG